jgi:hypothetical protein
VGGDQVVILDVADVDVDGQPVSRQADPAAAEILAKLLVLDRVEAVFLADRRNGALPARGGGVAGRASDGKEVVDHRPEDAKQLAGVLGVVGEVVDVRLAERVERFAPFGDHPGDLDRVIPRRHHRLGGVDQLGEGAPGVDPELVDDGLHGERQGVVEPALGPLHDRRGLVEERGLPLGRDEEGHPAARHPAEHQEPPEIVAERGPRLGDDRLGEPVAHPGDDPLDRPFPVLGRERAQRPHVRRPDRLDDPFEDPQRLLAILPFRLAPEQIFLRDHVQDRPDVLRHPAVDQHQAARQRPVELGDVAGFVRHVENLMRRQEPAPAHAPLGVGFGRRDPLDQLHSRENAARILPPAPRPAQPFPQDRPGDHHRRFLGMKRPGQVPRLPRRTHQDRDQRRQQVRRDGQTRPLGNVVDLAHDLETVARTDHLRQELVEPRGGPLERRGDQPGGDHSRLHQSQVIIAKVEQLLERRHILAGVEVDAREPEDRLGDHPHPALDRRDRLGVAPVDAQVDRDVQDSRSFRVIHPQEEDVGPGGVRKVEPDRRALDQDREQVGFGRALEQPGMESHGMLIDLADPEHPAVAVAVADRPADLVGEGLVGDLFIHLRQSAGDRAVRPFVGHHAPEAGQRLLEPALHQVDKPGVRNHPARRQLGGVLDPVAVDRVQEHRRAHALIEVPRALAKLFELVAGLQDLRRAQPRDQLAQRPIPRRRFGTGDRRDQTARERRSNRHGGNSWDAMSRAFLDSCLRRDFQKAFTPSAARSARPLRAAS